MHINHNRKQSVEQDNNSVLGKNWWQMWFYSSSSRAVQSDIVFACCQGVIDGILMLGSPVL